MESDTELEAGRAIGQAEATAEHAEETANEAETTAENAESLAEAAVLVAEQAAISTMFHDHPEYATRADIEEIIRRLDELAAMERQEQVAESETVVEIPEVEEPVVAVAEEPKKKRDTSKHMRFGSRR